MSMNILTRLSSAIFYVEIKSIISFVQQENTFFMKNKTRITGIERSGERIVSRLETVLIKKYTHCGTI